METYRRLELARLDALLAAHWASATSGSDHKAADLCIKVVAQRAKLLRLDTPPSEDERPRTIVIGGTSEEYIQGLKMIADRE